MKPMPFRYSAVVMSLTVALAVVACSKKNNTNPRVGAAQNKPTTPPGTPDASLEKPKTLETPPPLNSAPPKVESNSSESGDVVVPETDSQTDDRPTRDQAKQIDKEVQKTTMVESNAGYTQEALKADADSPSIFAIGLLDKDDATKTEFKMTCYDGKKGMDTGGAVWMTLLPKSQVLIELFNRGSDLDKLRQDLEKKHESKEDTGAEYVLTSCEGSVDSEKIQTSNYLKSTSYNVRQMADGDVQTAYFGVRRDAVSVSISCRSDLKSKESMTQEKDDSTGIVQNRITLTKNSRIIFAQPLDYYLKQDQKTLKELKPDLKNYVLFICK